MDTISRETTLSKLFHLPSEKWSTLKRKEFAPIGSKFIPFRVDTFSEGFCCAVQQTEIHKSCLCKVWQKNY